MKSRFLNLMFWFNVGAASIAGLLAAASWSQNPQGEFHDAQGLLTWDLLFVFLSWWLPLTAISAPLVYFRILLEERSRNNADHSEQ